ncbi:hypothetical protein CDIK_2042 [Cucumispora dikerogammari]|nr:hypothetical protein CDIK_2042 [Cucumispora dikerogammari]
MYKDNQTDKDANNNHATHNLEDDGNNNRFENKNNSPVKTTLVKLRDFYLKHNILFYFIIFITFWLNIIFMLRAVKIINTISSAVYQDKSMAAFEARYFLNITQGNDLEKYGKIIVDEKKLSSSTCKNIFKNLYTASFNTSNSYRWKERRDSKGLISNNIDPMYARNRICLISGEPGSGKTFFTKLLSYYIYNLLKKKGDPRTVCLINMSTGSIFDEVLNSSVKNLDNIFAYIRNSQQTKFVILVFDEADTLIEVSGDNDLQNGHLITPLRTQLLNWLGGQPKIDCLDFICCFSLIPNVNLLEPRWVRRCGTVISMENLASTRGL